MRKIRIIEQISLDGVIRAQGAPKEDGDYPHGGSAVPHADPAVRAAIENGPLADSLNAAMKYVATHRPVSLGWGPVEDLGPDIVEGVRRIKAGGRPDLIVWAAQR